MNGSSSLSLASQSLVPNQDNPFVGPRSLLRGEVLYGRDDEVRDLCNRIQARRIVVLHSPSGAGKSSLIHAGMIPRLKEAGFDIWRPIRVNLDTTGLDVPESTNRYLLSAMVSLEDELPENHRRSPAELAKLDFAQYLETRPRRKGRAGRKLALIFDQFEEVFTAEPFAVEAKRAFFSSVGQALENRNYWALFALREDYLGQLASYRELIPTQLSNTFRLNLLTTDAAREVAVKLAEQGGRSFPAADQLIRDLSAVKIQQPDGTFTSEPGLHVEPVQLQVVCRRLWAAMPEDDRSIDAEDIEKYGAVSASLAGYYASTVGKIAAKDLAVERAIREWIGSKLIVSGIRSQVRHEPEQSGGLDNDLIQALLASYLVRAEPRAGVTWYELSHDRLLEPALADNKRWEHENLHAVQLRARQWEAGRRSRALLLNANVDDVADIEQWAKANEKLLTESEREFLDQSRTQLDSERIQKWKRRALTTTAVVTAVAMAALGLWAVKEKNEGEAAREQAELAEEEAVRERDAAVAAGEAAKIAEAEAVAAQREALAAKDAAEALQHKNAELQQALFAKALRPAFIDEIVGRRHMGAIAAPEWITLYQFHTQLFVAATSVGDGRVMVAGSEAVLSVIDQRRESLFIEITVRWLRGDRERIVVVSDKPSAPENLMRTLQKLEYDATFLSRPGQVLTSTDLENVGALIVDNSTVPFTKEEIDAVRTFLAGGGGMLAVGTGLEWQGNLDDYPMNQLLAKSGAKWTGEAIHVEVKSTTTVSRPRIQILKDSDILTEKNKIEKAAVRCQARHESVNDSLRLKFKVKPNGRVSDARVNPEGLPVGECVLDKLAAQRFPESLQGGSFTWTVSLQ